MWIFEQLASYLSYPFVQYAFIAGILIALCASLLGVVLVLKRYSYIGDGLSHTAFGAMAIAFVLHMGNLRLLFIMPITIVCAILILRQGQRKKIHSDAMIAMFSVSSLAFGYLLMNVFQVSANVSGDVCSTLFGSTSILTLSKMDVYISLVFAILVTLLYIVFYRYIFLVTFDEKFAISKGIKTELANTLIAIVIAITVVLAMELVGSLLIAALIIFPSITSMLVFHSFKTVSISSAILAVMESLVGMVISVLVSTPVGSTIVMVDVVVFALVYIVSACLKKA